MSHSLFASFAQQASRTPEQVAIEQSQRLTYGELLDRAFGIRRRLLMDGGPVHSSVALLTPHGESSLLALLGIWSAGQVAVPLDPHSKESLLAERFEHSLATGIVCDSSTSELANQLSQKHCQIINIDDLHSESRQDFRPSECDSVCRGEHPAVIVYTSGSSARPKGVLHTHASILTNVRAHRRMLGLTSADSELMLSKLTTISGFTDCLRILLSGGRLLPVEPGAGGLTGIVQAIACFRPTIIHLIPTIFRRLARQVQDSEPSDFFDSVRVLHLGGELVTHRDFEIFRNCFRDDCLLLHNLGCTEVPSFRHSLFNKHSQVATGPLPLKCDAEGKVVELFDPENDHKVDNCLRPAEITVRTRQAASGYVNDRALTTHRFLRLPSGETRYRTGDIGQWMPDGSLVHLGRMDEEVKLLGRRLNLVSVEAILQLLPGIEEVAVVPVHTEVSMRLVAFCTGSPDLNREKLRDMALSLLEPWQLPEIVIIPELPTLPNGKLDRTLLKQRAAHLTTSAASQVRVERTAMEEKLADLWKTLLEIETVEPDASFFDLGGDSLHAVELLLAIRNNFGHRLGLRDLLANPTLEQMAAVLEKPVGPRQKYIDILRDGSDPLFVVGYAKTARLIADAVPNDQGVTYLSIPGLHETSLHYATIQRSVRHYEAGILAAGLRSPSAIVGYSYGGLLAFALAGQMWDRGARPVVVMLIEPTTPFRVRAQSDSTPSPTPALVASPPRREQAQPATSQRTWRARLRRPSNWWYPLRYGRLWVTHRLGRFITGQQKWELFRPVMRLNRRLYSPSVYCGDVLLVGSTRYLAKFAPAWRQLVSGDLVTISLGNDSGHHAYASPSASPIWMGALLERLSPCRLTRSPVGNNAATDCDRTDDREQPRVRVDEAAHVY